MPKKTTNKTSKPKPSVGTPAKKPSAKRGNRLGRGLEALLGVSATELSGDLAPETTPPPSIDIAERTPDPTPPEPGARASKEANSVDRPNDVLEVGPGRLIPSPHQPRRHFDQAGLDELALSISAHGILQPIIARPGASGLWEIVAGERRWRAAQLAKLTKIPIIVKELDEAQVMSIALVENLQRIDLNPVEKARGIDKLQRESKCNQQQIADLLGCSRAAVTNILRLLKLEPAVLEMLKAGRLQAGHARALLSLHPAEQVRRAKMVVEKSMNTAAVEEMVRKLGQAQTSPKNKPAKDRDLIALERKLSDHFGARVNIRATRRGGRITIVCQSNFNLEEIIDKLQKLS